MKVPEYIYTKGLQYNLIRADVSLVSIQIKLAQYNLTVSFGRKGPLYSLRGGSYIYISGQYILNDYLAEMRCNSSFNTDNVQSSLELWALISLVRMPI